jgi:hypothetical protein
MKIVLRIPLVFTLNTLVGGQDVWSISDKSSLQASEKQGLTSQVLEFGG